MAKLREKIGTTARQTPKTNPHAMWACGGMAAASFAVIASIINGRLIGPDFSLSFRCLSFALAPLLFYVYVGRDDDRHIVSWAARCFVVVGFMTFAVGIYSFVRAYDQIAANLFGLATALCLKFIHSAEGRARQMRPAVPEPTRAPNSPPTEAVTAPSATASPTCPLSIKDGSVDILTA